MPSLAVQPVRICSSHNPHRDAALCDIEGIAFVFAGKSESVETETDSDEEAAAKRNSRLLDDKIPEGCAIGLSSLGSYGLALIFFDLSFVLEACGGALCLLMSRWQRCPIGARADHGGSA